MIYNDKLLIFKILHCKQFSKLTLFCRPLTTNYGDDPINLVLAGVPKIFGSKQYLIIK